MKQHKSAAAARDRVSQDKGRKRAATQAYASGVEAMLAGNRAMAAALYQSCIALDPEHGEAHHGLGTIAALEQRPVEAATFFERTVALLPRHAEAYANLSVVLSRAGRPAEAVAAGRKAVAIRPSYVNGHVKLAQALTAAGAAEEAIGAYRAALELEPKSDLLHFWLADLLTRLERNEEALAACQAGIAIEPKRPDSHNLLGVIYKQLGQVRQSFEALHQAVTLKPDYPQAHINLAAVLSQAAQFEAASASGSIAIRLAPEDPAAYFNYAVALRYLGEFEKSLEMRRKAFALAPHSGEWLVDITTARRFMCDWDGLEAEEELAADLSYRSGRRVPPFFILTTSDRPAEHLASARAWARGLRGEPLPARPHAEPSPAEPRRLRIGYVSGDFYIHATALLIAGVLENHDRTRFELFGYSIGHNDGSAMRERLERSFDRFVDLRNLSNAEAARLIQADGIDILIDLKGYTDGARTEIFVQRPAPVQVNYLGYPGSMGAPFIDYVVLDAFVAPFADADHFDEKIVHLPHCYQPNDRRREVTEGLTRQAVGLPEGSFVFCCFNNTYKITAEMFGLWMRLLGEVPNSVLWLFGSNDSATGNLRREAEARGVAAERLIFAPRATTADHIARMGLGDLFLDTFPVNAHTTASEALWVGLPVVTYAGESFVSRVAGSLLHAVGLPELVTTSPADYEALALSLAQDPVRLAALKAKLLASRESSPLFDTARYTLDFEQALCRMAALHAEGRSPESFAVGKR